VFCVSARQQIRGKAAGCEAGALPVRSIAARNKALPGERTWEQFVLWMRSSGTSPCVPGWQLWPCRCPRASLCPAEELVPSRGSPLLPDSRLQLWGASLSPFSPVQTADTRATRNAAASSSWTAAGRASARASSRPRAPSCRPAARYAGEGAPWGGRQPHHDHVHPLPSRVLAPEGFYKGGVLSERSAHQSRG